MLERSTAFFFLEAGISFLAMGRASATLSTEISFGMISMPPSFTYSFSATWPITVRTESLVTASSCSANSGVFSFSRVICTFPVMSFKTINSMDLLLRILSANPCSFTSVPIFPAMSFI